MFKVGRLNLLELTALMNCEINLGFRLTDPDTDRARDYLKEFPNNGKGKEHPLYSENALAYDTVWAFAKETQSI